MSEAAQNVINSLQRQRLELMIKLDALQTDAKRHAYHAVVHGSWKARQDFRDAVDAGLMLGDEIVMIDLALAAILCALATARARLRRCDERLMGERRDAS